MSEALQRHGVQRWHVAGSDQTTQRTAFKYSVPCLEVQPGKGFGCFHANAAWVEAFLSLFSEKGCATLCLSQNK